MGDMLENEEFFHEQIGRNYSRALGVLKMAGGILAKGNASLDYDSSRVSQLAKIVWCPEPKLLN